MAPGTGTPGQASVLVVDDEDDLREAMCRILERRGYRALPAATPAQAVALLRHHDGPIDLLLADLGMPGASGRDLADLAVAMRPTLRVLFVSGLPPGVAAAQGLLGDGAPLVEKPFRAQRLVQAVESALA